MTLKPIESALLGTNRHGFFTRVGGVSTGVFKGLNCGYGAPENLEVITKNRQLIALHLAVPETTIFSVVQVHSANVITITDHIGPRLTVEADAMVTRQKNIAIGVLTADCAPVLFCDVTTNTIGAAHAGWRGALSGVLEATINAMCALGAAKHHITAVVGPCISQRNYEVGPEFLETFVDANPDYARFFINGAQHNYLFDLPSFALHRLREHKIKDAEWTGQCTYARPDTFYSYRYSQHNNLPSYGRMLSVITN